MKGLCRLHNLIIATCLALVLFFPCAAQVTLNGHVVDENSTPVRNALVTVRHVGPATNAIETQTDPTGAFTFELPEPGDYLVDVNREGFYALNDRAIQVQAPSQEISLTINSIR